MLIAVIGQTFHGTLAQAPIDQTPKRTPANVLSATGGPGDLLRPLQQNVPFRLMTPTVVESSPTSTTSGRSGSTGSTGGVTTRLSGSYSGWAAATSTGASRRPTGQTRRSSATAIYRTIRGRHYDLYYSGPHLHMVVLQQGGATYWVVNTLLDELSNETMLAIAKGLWPANRLPVAKPAA